jgi:hypothetical protein
MVTSEMLITSGAQTPYTGKTLRFVPNSRSDLEDPSLLQGLSRQRRDRSGSFDQSTVSTNKRLQVNPTGQNPDDLIELRNSNPNINFLRPSVIPRMNEIPRDRNEESKTHNRDIEAREEKIMIMEMANLRQDMADRNTSRTQEVMGEQVQMKRIHTKELS